MKRILPIVALSLIGSVAATAQEQQQAPVQNQQSIGAGVKVSGVIKDSLSNQALEFSSVTLEKSGSKAGGGISADSAGKFTFENITPGTYFLSVFYVGYDKMETMITIDNSGKDVDLGNVFMHAGNTALNEVKIVDFKQLIEQRPDGIVYNAEKDLTNKGSMADELLRKVPMVTVDLDGNVQMRGSSNIRVFIDGKPSTMIAASVKDALKQIPADNVKSVEVITSPGAKYEGEGAAGVINIITKKNRMKGISGSVFSQLSYNVPREFFTGNLGFNLNYRNNNFGLAANAGYSRWQMYLETQTDRVDFPGSAAESTLKQNNEFDGLGDFFWSQITADYQIDSLQSIQAGVNYNPGTWKQDVNLTSSFAPALDRITNSKTPRSNVGFNAAYSKKFKNNPKRTLDILSQYSMNTNTAEYELNSVNRNTEVVNYREKNRNKNNNNEFTIQADYVHPLKKHSQKIETGVKYINRDITSDFELQSSAGNGSAFEIDPRRTNRLDYQQDIAAAYGQFSTKLTKSLSMIAGARYEFTNIDGKQNEANSAFNTQFHNVLPNLNFSYDFKDFSKLKLAYNMRIQRPSIDFVNPYVNYSDQYNISQGNPMLVPENTHNVELGYSTYVKNTSLNLSAFYRHTGNAIENVTTVGSDNVSRTTFQNIAKNNTLGFDFFGSTNLFERWMINLNANAYYLMLNSPSLDVENSGWQFKGSIYSSFKISDRFSLAGYGMYNGTQIQLQGSKTSWYYYFVGLQTTVLKGKGTITLAGENFFTPEVKMTTKYNYQNAIFTQQSTYYGGGVRLSFNWSFGKMNFMKTKGVKNDDLKSGDTGQPGMGGN